MRKDIFIDNNIAKNFCNPLDPEYKNLIKWLKTYNDMAPDQNAYLVVSNKLLAEYQRTAMGSSATNIIAIIAQLTKEGRILKISNEQIKTFKQKYFTKKVEKDLKSNREDREHIPVVLLSDRKYALAIDKNFIKDLLNFPGFTVTVKTKPQDLPYDH